MATLFVGGFPLDIDEIELVKLFMPVGQVNTIQIVRDKKTRVCKGYAFIEMADREKAEEAVTILNGTAIADRVITVKITEDKVKVKAGYEKPSSSDAPKYIKLNKPGEQLKAKRPRKTH